MKRKIITIENDCVRIPFSGEIWMSEHEIARLLDCFVAKVSANVRAILRADVLEKTNVCQTYYYQNGNSVELYNLEMITALAFRVQSRNSDMFRSWMMKKVLADASQKQVLLISGKNNSGFSLN